MKPIQKPYRPALLPLLVVGCAFWGSPDACPGQLIVPFGGPKAGPPANPNPEKNLKRPAWVAVEKSAKAALAQLKDYKPGDLITREDGAGVFAALKKAGWEVKKSSELSERMLPSSDEMVRELRSKQGKNFMRNIGSVPGGYDRLDRVRTLPLGSRRLREFIQQPDGHKLIEYMATTPGGKQMGRQLSSKNRGDFNEPTQRIYTEQQLLAELKTLYQAETEARSKPAVRY